MRNSCRSSIRSGRAGPTPWARHHGLDSLDSSTRTRYIFFKDLTYDNDDLTQHEDARRDPWGQVITKGRKKLSRAASRREQTV